MLIKGMMIPTVYSEPKHHILIACICIFWLSTSSATREDVAEEFIEHMLGIPNAEKVLNSVIGRLERSRQEQRAKPHLVDDADCDEPEAYSEYTESLQNSQEREMRQLGPQKHYPICHLERKIHRLNTNEYEYRPAYYEEVRCTMTPNDDGHVGNEICSSLGFSCVQWNKTIHLTRRRYSSDCWETRTMIIPAGCECMWPVHRLGDMSMHG